MKNWIKLILLNTFVLGAMAVVPTSLAQECQFDPVTDPLGTSCIEQGTGGTLTKTDPRIVAARIINVVLGVLGTIATILIFYAGFLWMTAAGNDDQVGKAKSIMSAAVIGLIVVLASYSISTFFVNSIMKAVNPGSPAAGG